MNIAPRPQPTNSEHGAAQALPEPHPDGMYFGQDAATYHGAINLGSHSVVRLHTGGPYYWWESWMNPLRPEDKDIMVKSFQASKDFYSGDGTLTEVAARNVVRNLKIANPKLEFDGLDLASTYDNSLVKE